ncbi:MAG: TonB-dependent siderophore receptor [Nostoc sp.]|uniref:TonB-dependent siderophore receptor n=1 Tax=Nostoc sp. TaxID=1180 RepID=UPI002FFC972A
MKQKQLVKIFLLTISVWLWGAISATATVVPKKEVQSKSVASVLRNSFSIKQIHQLSELERPSTSATMLVQSPTPSPGRATQVVPITSVKANPTDKGVEIILETPQGTQLQVTNRSTGNNFIADVSSGQLRLPSGEAFTFRSEKPSAEITQITVTNVDANTVRVTVVDVAAMPTVELFDDNVGLVFRVASAATATQPPQQPQTPASETPQQEPAAQQDQPIELVVTGEQDGYNVPDATTATRTDTPLHDIPQSIQVVPRQVIEDRNTRTIAETVETVSGVVNRGSNFGTPSQVLTIRGFNQQGNFRNGFRDVSLFEIAGGTNTIDRIEVLKGPASVLFGQVEPGGIVNIVTRQPLSEPYYNLAFEAGSFGYYQPIIDLSGPLTTDKTVLYRFIGSYEASDSFQDFVHTNFTTVAPSITFNIGERTKLNLYYEYLDYNANPPTGYATLLSDGRLTPRDRYLSYPDIASVDVTTQKYGYTFNHKFSDNWQIRNNLAVVSNKTSNIELFGSLVDDRFLEIGVGNTNYTSDNYSGQLDVLGKFKTGWIAHQLLVGFDFTLGVNDGLGFYGISLPTINIFDPDYDVLKPNYDQPTDQYKGYTRNYGVYLQDQIAFSDNFKLLIGGRYDWALSTGESFIPEDSVFTTEGNAFSPRIGLVYQPIEPVSLYASYSRSFVPNSGRSVDDELFEPSRGTQYEIGVRGEFLDGKLSTNLAVYHLTKTNVTTSDLDNPGFSILTGKQRSQGIELDVSGEILPGLKVIASYAYTNAEVTKDNDIPVGNRLLNVPEHQASLWTTYEIQQGNLQGLGFGLGLFYVGPRQGDLANSFQVDDYLRTDAALYYRRARLKAAINIRNLFDIYYVSTVEGDRSFIGIGEPLSIVGSISWEF